MTAVWNEWYRYYKTFAVLVCIASSVLSCFISCVCSEWYCAIKFATKSLECIWSNRLAAGCDRITICAYKESCWRASDDWGSEKDSFVLLYYRTLCNMKSKRIGYVQGAALYQRSLNPKLCRTCSVIPSVSVSAADDTEFYSSLPTPFRPRVSWIMA